MEKNVKIFKSIIPQVVKYAPESILLITANPVDIMTDITLKLSGFPKERVFGSGTVLDTARFRTLLGYHLGISPKSIHANVLGEHGDSEVLVWSNGDAGTMRIDDLAKSIDKPLKDEVKAQIDDCVRNAAYKIINGKGATYYGIAGALSRICQAIGSNEYAVLTVSSLHDNIEGVENVCMSLPSIVGKRGIQGVLHPNLSDEERKALQKSAQTLKDFSQKAEKIIAEN